jgi:two-component system NtrC family response regulator
MAQILVADDDRAFREVLSETLIDLGHNVRTAALGEETLNEARREAVDLLLLDLRLPDIDGLEVLRRLRVPPFRVDLPVVILTAYPGSHTTIEAMKLGAFDYLSKPVSRDDLGAVLCRALARPQPRVSAASADDYADEGLVGTSLPMRQVHKLIGLAANHDVTVLITGESGTGKECVARALHRHSTRGGMPFVAVNCAALPADLLESELFGHRRGAFTGAVVDRRGRFVEAAGGCLFLDEIGDMSLAMQAKILRVIQEREVTPVGASLSEKVDIRIIAATHGDLLHLVQEGRFREDLFYRLHVLHISLPPLRDRGSDILLLAEHFLQRARTEPPKRLTNAAAKALLEYDWPGNVRELENLMQRLRLVVRGPIIDLPDIPAFERGSSAALTIEALTRMGFHTAVATLERYLIERALLTAQGNRAEAARGLGMRRQLLYDKIKEYAIQDTPQ